MTSVFIWDFTVANNNGMPPKRTTDRVIVSPDPSGIVLANGAQGAYVNLANIPRLRDNFRIRAYVRDLGTLSDSTVYFTFAGISVLRAPMENYPRIHWSLGKLPACTQINMLGNSERVIDLVVMTDAHHPTRSVELYIDGVRCDDSLYSPQKKVSALDPVILFGTDNRQLTGSYSKLSIRRLEISTRFTYSESINYGSHKWYRIRLRPKDMPAATDNFLRMCEISLDNSQSVDGSDNVVSTPNVTLSSTEYGSQPTFPLDSSGRPKLSNKKYKEVAHVLYPECYTSNDIRKNHFVDIIFTFADPQPVQQVRLANASAIDHANGKGLVQYYELYHSDDAGQSWHHQESASVDTQLWSGESYKCLVFQQGVYKHKVNLASAGNWTPFTSSSKSLLLSKQQPYYLTRTDEVDPFALGGTVCAWVRVNSLSAPMDILGMNQGSYYHRLWRIETTGKVRVYSDETSFVTGNTVLSIYQWYLLSYTWDLTSNVVTLYVNGMIDASGTVQDRSYSGAPVTTYIGNASLTVDTRFSGHIDDISVYETNLTSTQMTDMYLSTVPMDLKALDSSETIYSWWTFESSSGADSSPYNRALTVGGERSYARFGTVRGTVNYTWNSSWTCSFWVKRIDTTGHPFFIDTWNGSSHPIRIYWHDADGIKIGFLNPGGTGYFIYDKRPLDTTWHHVVVTYQNSVYKLYVDGIVPTVTVEGTPPVFDTSRTFFYLGNNADNSQTAKYYLQDFAIHNVAIDASAVARIYNNGTPLDLLQDPTNTNLQLYLRLGSNANDSKGSYHVTTWNNGTLPTFTTETVTYASVTPKPPIENKYSLMVPKTIQTTSLAYYDLGTDSTLSDLITYGSFTMSFWFRTNATTVEIGTSSIEVGAIYNQRWGQFFNFNLRGTSPDSYVTTYGSKGYFSWWRWMDGTRSDGAGYMVVHTSQTLNDGKWHHIILGMRSSNYNAGTRQGTFTMYTFIDGVERTSAVSITNNWGNGTIYTSVSTAPFTVTGYISNNTILASPNNAIVWGARYRNNVVPVPFDFQVDEHAIFSTGMTVDEIMELYNSGKPLTMTQHSKSAQLQVWWRAENSGKDESGKNRHLTLNGTQFFQSVPSGLNQQSLQLGGSNTRRYLAITNGDSMLNSLYNTSTFAWVKLQSSGPCRDPTNYWPLQHSSLRLDSSGRMICVNNSTTLVHSPCENTNVFDLNGTNQYAKVDSSDISFVHTYSRSVWIKTTTTARAKVLSCYIGNDSGAYFRDLEINTGGSGAIRLSTNFAYYEATGTAVNNGSWHHVVVTHDSSHVIRLYLDGTLLSGTTAGTSWTPSVTAPGHMVLGSKSDLDTTSVGLFTGQMDEISIWNKVLNQSEVSEIYNQGVPTDLRFHSAAANLQAYYKFDSTMGYHYDSSEKGRSLVYYGSPSFTTNQAFPGYVRFTDNALRCATPQTFVRLNASNDLLSYAPLNQDFTIDFAVYYTWKGQSRRHSILRLANSVRTVVIFTAGDSPSDFFRFAGNGTIRSTTPDINLQAQHRYTFKYVHNGGSGTRMYFFVDGIPWGVTTGDNRGGTDLGYALDWYYHTQSDTYFDFGIAGDFDTTSGSTLDISRISIVGYAATEKQIAEGSFPRVPTVQTHVNDIVVRGSSLGAPNVCTHEMVSVFRSKSTDSDARHALVLKVPGVPELQTSASYQKDKWYHVGYTIGPQANPCERKIYVDGSMVASDTFDPALVGYKHNPSQFWIGRDSTGGVDPNRHLSGSIDELATWNTVLSSSEVAKVYQGTVSPIPGLQGWWRFEGDPNMPDETGLPSFQARMSFGKNDSTFDSVYSTTATSVTYTTIFGKDCVQLNSNSAIGIQGNSALVTLAGSNHGFSFWFRPNNNYNYSSAGRLFRCWQNDNPTGAARAEFHVYVTRANGLDGIYFASTGSFHSYVELVKSGLDQDWVHVYIRVNPLNKTYEFFANGVSYGVADVTKAGSTYTTWVPTSSSSQSGYYIGYGSGESFQGYLADFRIYHTVLTNAQISQLYGRGLDSSSKVRTLVPYGSSHSWAQSIPSASVSTTVANTKGLSLDGSGQWAHALNFVPSDQWLAQHSISMWINARSIDSYNSTNRVYLYSLLSTDTGSGYTFRGLQFMGTYFQLAADNFTTATNISYTIRPGRWYHIVCTWTPTAATLYINGTLAASNTSTFHQAGSSPSTLKICRDGEGKYNWNGMLDEIMFWNSTLTGSEVVSLYNEGRSTNALVNFDNYVSKDNLKAWWRFENGLVDFTGNGYTLTLQNGSTTRALTGLHESFTNQRSMYFDGKSYATRSGASYPSNYTVSVWICSRQVPQTTATLVTWTNGANYRELAIHSSGVFMFYNTGGANDPRTTKVINDGAWHHCAVTVDSANGYRLYVDGEYQAPIPGSLTAVSGMVDVSDPYIGGRYVEPVPNATSVYQGYMDELAIWNTVLTAEQIRAVYNQGAPSNLMVNFSANLQGYWRFETDNGMDTSPNGRTLTISGATFANAVPNKVAYEPLRSLSISTAGHFTSTPSGVASSWNRSYSVWVYINTFSTSYAPLLLTNYEADHQTRGILVLNTGVVQVYSGATGSSLNSNGKVATGGWYHVVATYGSDASKPVRLYLNGSLDNSAVLSTLSTMAGDGTMYIGQAPCWGNAQRFEWLVDEVSVWSKELTAEEVWVLYNSGSPTALSSNSLVAWWPFGDSTPEDRSGNGRTLSLSGTSYSTMVPSFSNGGYSVQFGGTLYASVESTNWIVYKNFTVSAWIRMNSVNRYNEIFSIGNTVSPNDYRPLFRVGGDNRLQLESNNEAGVVSASTQMYGNTWYHVSCTFDAYGNVKLFLNGNQDGTGTRSALPAFTSGTTYVYLGKYGTSTLYFDGSMKDVCIWNTTLTPDEIKAVYNLGKPIDVSKNLGNYVSSDFLQAWWRFNTQSGADSSGKGRSLSWSSTPSYSNTVIP